MPKIDRRAFVAGLGAAAVVGVQGLRAACDNSDINCIDDGVALKSMAHPINDVKIIEGVEFNETKLLVRNYIMHIRGDHSYWEALGEWEEVGTMRDV